MKTNHLKKEDESERLGPIESNNKRRKPKRQTGITNETQNQIILEQTRGVQNKQLGSNCDFFYSHVRFQQTLQLLKRKKTPMKISNIEILLDAKTILLHDRTQQGRSRFFFPLLSSKAFSVPVKAIYFKTERHKIPPQTTSQLLTTN